MSRAHRRPFRWLLVVIVIVAGAVVAIWLWARPDRPDAFYDAPEGLQVASPGALVRSEPFSRGLPEGAQGWRILYWTTRRDGSPALASGLVVAPASAAGAPRPVVAWAHGTTGLARGCAPSMLAAPLANTPAVDGALKAGWTIVAADYVGLGTEGGHAYLVGDDAARAVLDSIRAARRLPQSSATGDVVVWGHSQGGASALWTGQTAPDYAPDLPIRGVAALAPASDLPALVQRNMGSGFGKLVTAFMATAYDRTYPDSDARDLIGPWSRIIVSDISSRCIADKRALVSALETKLLPSAGIFRRDLAGSRFLARLTENTPMRAISVPLLVGQGLADDAVFPAIQARYVQRRCAGGQAIDYRTYPGRDHISLLAPDSPLTTELLAWTKDRFAGAPARDSCPR